MYPIYADIRELIEKSGAKIWWHDAEGVPRVQPFHPRLLGVYDRWALEFEVSCQSCSRKFLCAAGCPDFVLYPEVVQIKTFKDAVDRLLNWGDAPWHGLGKNAQCAGTTMTTDCEPVRLWSLDSAFDPWRVVEYFNKEEQDLFEQALSQGCTGVTETCPVDECCACAMRDCPGREPLHYHHDGCPYCYIQQDLDNVQ